MDRFVFWYVPGFGFRSEFYEAEAGNPVVVKQGLDWGGVVAIWEELQWNHRDRSIRCFCIHDHSVDEVSRDNMRL